jgi:hypothetical protein
MGNDGAYSLGWLAIEGAFGEEGDGDGNGLTRS